MCNEKNTVLIISPRLDDVTATAIRPPSHSVAFDSSDREVSSSRCLVYLYNYKTQIIKATFYRVFSFLYSSATELSASFLASADLTDRNISLASNVDVVRMIN